MVRQGMAVLAVLSFATTAQANWSPSANETESASSEYDQAVALVVAEDYQEALKALLTLDASKPGDADVVNLIAFSYRKLGYYDQAGETYTKALNLDPNHLGALAYQGELFITLGDMDAAKANLVKLESLCPSGCEDRTALETALAGS